MLPLTVSSGIQPPPVVIIPPTNPVLPEAVLGRLPVSTVNASVAAAESYNQKNGSPTPRAPFETEAASPVAFSDSFTAAPAVGETPSQPGFSTPFLAQLFGQSSAAEGSALSAFYTRPVRIPLDNHTWQSYSLIRYKPSDAALPPPPSPREEVFGKSDAPATLPLPAPKADAQPQVKETADAAPSLPAVPLPQTDVIAPTAQTQAQQTLPPPPATPAPPQQWPQQEEWPQQAWPASAPEPALPAAIRRVTVSARGADAYSNASARGDAYASASPEQVTVSL